MDNRRVLSYVIGSNGAGKSTLARNVLGGNIIPNKHRYGYFTLSEDYNTYPRTREKIVAIGRYTSACGGVDTVKPLSNAYRLGVVAATMYPDSNIFMESLIMSHLFSSPMKFMLGMKYEHGFEVEICFLFASLRESLRRVFGRNGGTPIKPDCVKSKLNSTVTNYKKLMSVGEFRGIAIDTTSLTPEEVFLKFRNWSGLYEKNS